MAKRGRPTESTEKKEETLLNRKDNYSKIASEIDKKMLSDFKKKLEVFTYKYETFESKGLTKFFRFFIGKFLENKVIFKD